MTKHCFSFFILFCISVVVKGQNHFNFSFEELKKGMYTYGLYKCKANTIDTSYVRSQKIVADSSGKLANDYQLRFGKIDLISEMGYIPSIHNIRFFSINDIVEYLYTAINFKYKGLPINDMLMDIKLLKYVLTDDQVVYYKQVFPSFKMDVKENMKIENYIAGKITENLDSLDLIKINLYREEGKPIAVFHLGIYGNNYRLKDDYELVYRYNEHTKSAYEVFSDLFAHHSARDKFVNTEPYTYQLIETTDGEVLKTDTNYLSVQPFLKYSRKQSRTEILHLERFKTKERFINLSDYWQQCSDCKLKTELLKLSDKEMLNLYEYCPATDSCISMRIGELVADWNLKLYDKSWFLKNVEKGVFINLPEGEFTPVYMELVVFDTNGYSHFITTDDIKNKKLQTVWDQLPDIAGVKVQNIVFMDNNAKRTRLLRTFHFYIGR